MVNKHLATYLNDHLAGSVMALELIEHLAAANTDTAIERFLTGLHADIAMDRQELETFMDRLDIGRSLPRRAGAWLAEKISELKLLLDDPGDGPLRLFEGLEVVSLGIEGKRALWLALATAAEVVPALREFDYPRLTRRAEEQRARVEEQRLEAAREAFRSGAEDEGLPKIQSSQME